ncbi:MAG TPA: hypothetical protein VM098_10355 [Phycisphaerae bacterium]|nr:hypothetical protein [Phycisphaerae bacterium]
MMLGTQYLAFAARITTMVVPVWLYFLILGLLNSRRTPQLISGRRDFTLMVAALSPLFVLPVLQYLGATLVTAAAAVAALVGIVVLLGPRGSAWVIYNMPAEQARNVIATVLKSLGHEVLPEKDGFRLGGEGASVRIGGFPLLRNISVRLEGGGRELADRFESALSQSLAGTRAETTPMAVSMLLIATAMMVLPLTLMAHRVPELVRILTDLFQ